MSDWIKQALFVAPAALGATLAFSAEVTAQSLESEFSTHDLIQQVENYRNEGNHELGQGLGASQFSDVSPRDWAFQALDDLTRRYGCLKGYPNGTFRGNRALTRYEFAAGLNACLQQMERLIAEVPVDPGDADTIRRLTSSFEDELLALSAQVDGLESRVTFLEDNQFSTTTKLHGNVVWNLGAPFGGDNILNGNDEFTFDYRAQLTFDTSFSGKDLLRTRLDTGNSDPDNNFFGGSLAGSSGFINLSGQDNNNINIDKLFYRTPIGDNIQAHIVAHGALIDGAFDTSAIGHSYSNVPIGIAYNTNFYDISGANLGAALAFNIRLSDSLGIDVGYFAGDAPKANQGLFSGGYGVPVQLNLDFGDKLDLAVGYLFSYTNNTSFNMGTGGTSNALNLYAGPQNSNHYMASMVYDLSDNVQLHAYGSYVHTTSVSGPTNGFNAETWAWAGNLAFVDLAQEGDILSLGFGRLPTALRLEGLASDSDPAYMANLEYRFKVNENIELTPSVFAIFNPNGQSSNDTIYASVLRTMFSF